MTGIKKLKVAEKGEIHWQTISVSADQRIRKDYEAFIDKRIL